MANDDLDRRFSWIITILAASYVLATGYNLATRVQSFERLFAGLGADLPVITQFAIKACNPIIVWIVSIAATAFLVIKEVKMKRATAKALVSTIVFMLAGFISALVSTALEIPMLALMRQIG